MSLIKKSKIILPPILLIISTIYIYIPSLIYYSNRQSFDNYFINLISTKLLFVLILVGIVWMFLLLIKYTILKLITSFLMICAILLWFEGDFFVISYGVMDGSDYDFSGFSWRYWYEIIIITIVIIASLKYNRFINRHFPFILTLIVSGQLLTVSYKIITESKDKIVIKKIDQELFNYSSKKNIIVIILDTFGGDYFQSIMQSTPNLAKKFPGFINYTNATSNYPATSGSLPSILTGEMLPNDILIGDFVASRVAKKGLPKIFEKRGYLVSMVSTREEFESYYNKRFIAKPTLDINILNKYNVYRLLDYALFRVMPMAFKPFIYNNGYWAISNNLAKPVKIPRFNSERGLYMLNLMTEKVKVESKQNRFKIIHALLPHPRLIYDHNCNRTRTREKTIPKMLEQSKCALKTLNQLLDEYKKLGIYDSSLIVVMSDHGARIFADKSLTGFPSYFEMASSNTLLMIKGMNQKSLFKNIDTPVSLRKLYNMLIDENNHTKQIDFLKDNDRKFYSYGYEQVIQNGYLPDGALFSIGENSLDPKSWKFEKLITHNCPTIKIPTTIKLLKKRYMNYCAKFGFSKPEFDNSGSWTESKDVRVLLKLNTSNKKPTDYLNFEINFTPFIKAEQKELILDFYINGTFLHTQNVSNTKKNYTKIKAPVALIKVDGITELKILIPNLHSEKDMGISSDSRKLGILLHTIKVD